MGWKPERQQRRLRAVNGAGSGMNTGRNYTRFLFRRVALSSLFRKDDFLRGMMDWMGVFCLLLKNIVQS